MKLQVNASKKYDITITRGFDEFGAAVKSKLTGGRVALITDDAVAALYGERVLRLLGDFTVTELVIKSGEKSKNGENFLYLVNALAENGFQRGDAVIALGGGVVGDLAGFVASAYMRGITLISMPTTLLSAVDSSVGGKTAIDLPAGKNLCGSFYQPSAVYINLDFLSSLPEKELLNGFGEVIKYSFLDARVSLPEKPVPEEKLIYDCLVIKKEVVENDEFESGRRMILNLGHTVGHAIEKLSAFTLSHGECVAKGLAASVAVSRRLFGLNEIAAAQMLKALKRYGYDLSPVYSADTIAECIASDKKSAGAEVNFVALKEAGTPAVQKISIDLIKEILETGYEY